MMICGVLKTLLNQKNGAFRAGDKQKIKWASELENAGCMIFLSISQSTYSMMNENNKLFVYLPQCW